MSALAGEPHVGHDQRLRVNETVTSAEWIASAKLLVFTLASVRGFR